MNTITPSEVFHRLSEPLLNQVAPVCAAAGIRLIGYPGFHTAPDTVLCGLESFSDVQRVGKVFLLGEVSQTQQLYQAATGTAAQVVVMPAAAAWFASELSQSNSASSGKVTVFAGAVGGAGCTTAAVLAGYQLAQQGKSVLLIDGVHRPTPHVGLASYLPAPSQSQGHWDQLLNSPELPLVSRIKDALPMKSCGQGSLFWLVAEQDAQTLPTRVLVTLIERCLNLFDHVLVDVSDPCRAGSLTADDYLLVTPVSRRGDAACFHQNGMGIRWQLLLNGQAEPGWTPQRFRDLAQQPVKGRIKPFTKQLRDIAALARRKDVPNFGQAVTRGRHQRPVLNRQPQLPQGNMLHQRLLKTGLKSS